MSLCKVSYSVDFPSAPSSFSFLISSSYEHPVHDCDQHYHPIHQFLPNVNVSALVASNRNLLRPLLPAGEQFSLPSAVCHAGVRFLHMLRLKNGWEVPQKNRVPNRSRDERKLQEVVDGLFRCHFVGRGVVNGILIFVQSCYLFTCQLSGVFSQHYLWGLRPFLAQENIRCFG